MNQIKVKLKTDLCKTIKKFDFVKIDDIEGHYLGDEIFIFYTNKLPIRGMIKYLGISETLPSWHWENHIDLDGQPFIVINKEIEFYYKLI